jgi:hypothetical protein
MAKRKPHRAGTDTGTGADQQADKQRVPSEEYQPPYVAFLDQHSAQTSSKPAATTAPHRRFGDRGADPDDAPLTRLVRYVDLARAGFVRNRTQLERLVRDEGMPPGRMLSSKTRVWTVDEIEEWLGTRPLAGKRQADAAEAR